jgi:hypothetical protein
MGCRLRTRARVLSVTAHLDSAVPLALPDLPEQIGRRPAEYPFDERLFWTAVPSPSGALDEPSFLAPGALLGSATVLARADVGQQRVAAMAGHRTSRLRGAGGHARPSDRRNGVARGLREFYDPHDGRGVGAQDFAWSALALEFLDPANANAGVPASA